MKAEGRSEFVARRFVSTLVGDIEMELHFGILFSSDRIL